MLKKTSIELAIIVLACLSHEFSKANNNPNVMDNQVIAKSDKSQSMFYPADLLKRLRTNILQQERVKQIATHVIDKASPWVEMSDDQLWSLMFGATPERSWMVWSNGHCPACNESVPMYNWEIDALEVPWKTRCPHCKDLFPKNDFYAFYRSGLDGNGIFSLHQADRSLLFNTEHPDPADPLHSFGVDDGTGYVEGDNRWRFIGAYLIYGQWKQAVLGGIQALADAYIVTEETIYARKAAILLDRVADLYPTFDFAIQGYNYERQGTHGYLGNWHDACEETRELALAYDMVFEGMKQDSELTAFLAQKARDYGLANAKNSFAAIQQNIEDRILRDALANPHKIHSNYPRQDIAILVIRAVLNQPREQWYPFLDAMLEKATAVDGVTGEKGLANYSSGVIQTLADLLALWNRAEPSFLQRCLDVHPALHQTYRFHIDTWCLQKYYPLVGDTGWFAQEIDIYKGVLFRHPDAEDGWHGRRALADAPLEPSMYSFLWDLYRLTGDASFVQVLYLANDRTVEGLPHDMFVADKQAVLDGVTQVIAKHGEVPAVGNVNKAQWRLAILRSGRGADTRAVWLNYQAGGRHGHRDAMNLGLFAYGLDLMPEFGYPPVQYGGWGSPKARWYTMSAAHNTVVVDGQDHRVCQGETTLWAEGQNCRAIRASAPEAIHLADAVSKKRPISDSWKFIWDPARKGEAQNWQSVSFDDSDWFDIHPDVAWQQQDVGKQWKQQHGSDYEGIAWYRSRFKLKSNERSPKILFGAVDAACTVWVNDIKILERPYPYLGNTASWDQGFVLDIRDVVHYDRPNTLAVRVDNVAGEGGIKRGVWLLENPLSPQFERTIVQVDMPEPDKLYVLDIFRVAGGKDHTLFMHSHFGDVQSSDLSLTAGEDYGGNTQMRNFRWDAAAQAGWQVDWRIEDRYKLLPPGKEVYLRYTSLTTQALAALAEAWVSYGGFGGDMRNEAWIPRLLVRRQTTEPMLSSTFVGVIEPYEKVSSIKRMQRLTLVCKDGRNYPDSAVAVEIIHSDGTQDLIIAVDVENPHKLEPSLEGQGVLLQPDWNVILDGELCLVRKNKSGELVYLWAANARTVRIEDRLFNNEDPAVLLEWREDK